MRQDLFDGETSFSGNFGKDCQTDSVPKTLLIQMMLESTRLFLAADNQTKSIALQLSQLIKFSALKKQRDQKVVHVRHPSSQITALALMHTEKEYY